MGKVEVTYKNRKKLLEETLKTTDVVLSILKMMRERIELSPDEFSSVLNESNDPSLSENRNLDYYIQKGEKAKEYISQMRNSISGKDIPTKDIEVFRNSMKSVLEEFVSLMEEEEIKKNKGEQRIKAEFSSAISELKKIEKSKKPSQIQVPKDIWKAQIDSVGDTLSYI